MRTQSRLRAGLRGKRVRSAGGSPGSGGSSGSQTHRRSRTHWPPVTANLTDSFSFLQPVIKIATSNDVSRVSIDASSKSALELIHLNGIINTYSDGRAIKWTPSYFVLNQKKWDIENGGILSIRKNNTYAKNFKLSQGLQELVISSGSNNNSLQLGIKNLILGDLTKVFFS